ncbi:MAG: aspartate carbamoyltransferase regulatory subunit, partial [Euryarchaeota archaeon]|nr:aspartate carbamoyltransferase regulatory subunit [Euryarchaeota archaeon]
MSEMRRVTAICNGTVVDHIPAGKALQVMQMLRVDVGRSNPISLVMNVPSGKVGRKDVLKIEDRELTQVELDRLALIAPHASVAIIRNYSVAEKREIELGEELVNIARCSFWNCITQNTREPL